MLIYSYFYIDNNFTLTIPEKTTKVPKIKHAYGEWLHLLTVSFWFRANTHKDGPQTQSQAILALSTEYNIGIKCCNDLQIWWLDRKFEIKYNCGINISPVSFYFLISF